MKRNLLSTCLLTAIIVCQLQPAYAGESPADQAAKKLAEKNISVDNDSFIKEVSAGHADNVQLFLMAGATAGSQNKDGTTALIAAIVTGNKEVIDLLFSTLPQNAQAAASVNLQDKEGNTALHKAIQAANEEIVTTLLARGADITLKNKSGATALHIAAQAKSDNILKVILAANARLDKTSSVLETEDGAGNTALTYAITLQKTSMAKLLVDAHADVQAADVRGVTPIMHAAEAGDETVTSLLLDAGAKLEAANKSGDTALTLAIRHGHSKLARMLMDKAGTTGAGSAFFEKALATALEGTSLEDDFLHYLMEHINAEAKLPASMLFKALEHKNHDVAAFILKHKPDIKTVDESGNTLLNRTVEAGFEDIALDLMQQGADFSQAGAENISPIAHAASKNLSKIVSALLDKGASADQKTAEGYTLAEMCVYKGYAETLEVLLSRGINLDKDFALLWAIRDGKGKAVPVLLDHGATPNIMNQDGITALALSAEAGQTEAVQAFIKHKAELNYPNKLNQMTALAAAAHYGHPDIVKLLVEAGATLESVDNLGLTPLAHAAMQSQAEVVEYLLSKGANASAVDGQKRSVTELASLAPASAARDKTLQALAAARK